MPGNYVSLNVCCLNIVKSVFGPNSNCRKLGVGLGKLIIRTDE